VAEDHHEGIHMPNCEKKIFNHDILLNDGDTQLARQQYPNIGDILEWPELQQAFKPHEESANQQKKASRQRGMRALGCALVALWLSTLEPRIHDLHPGIYLVWGLTLLIALFGICGLLLGSQILRGKKKIEWLHHRAATERLRQLHFQWIVRRIVQIAGADGDGRDNLIRERNKILTSVKHDMGTGVTQPIETIVADLGSIHCWMVNQENQHGQHSKTNKIILDELFSAYTKLRFRHQADYVMRKLGKGYGIWPWEVEGQARRIHETANILTVTTIAIDLFVLPLMFFTSSNYENLILWLQTVSIMSALAVLALRVLDEGVRPRADVARLRNYRGEVEELFRKFMATGDTVTKLSFMERMEELSYRELRDFLTVHEEASFVL
jgi:hypothetical protein